jgi:hypothetical protein
VFGPPRLWTILTQVWCPVPPPLGWLWWRALLKAEDPLAAAWRQAFLDFDGQDRAVSGDVVMAFLTQIATPHALMALCEQLQGEGTLLKRDAHQLEELLLQQCTAEGQWKHQQPRKGKV